MRLFKACGWAELRKVASGSATQSLWLEDRKVRFQVIGVDEADSLKEDQLGKLGEEEDEKEGPATERKREYRDLEL